MSIQDAQLAGRLLFMNLIILCIIMVEIFDVSVKKWGHSLGAVLPNNII